MKTSSLLILGGIAMSTLIGCQAEKSESKCCAKTETTQKAPYKKKYTNADFYKDGKLQADVALAAYLDMFEYYGIPYTDFLKKNMFISDFELGDFENVGMAGVFFINDADNGYFGHDIFLLPEQMIVEHKHLKTAHAAKMESWQIRNGWCYNFGTGEPTPGAPTHPASQNGFITVANFSKLNEGDIATLNEREAPHFLRAGDNGAIVTEYGTFHDNDGLTFTNPKVNFVDILQK